ncbi:SCO family protein [Oryzomonas rubra]|uniref:SCO family protein n=1 Tax=Oryzomonas rubra TaxID=2509454 RepID=UPI001FE62D4C|nr:SCO family protein [Oryzomonas rubra]
MLLAVLMLCPCRVGAHSEEASQKHQAGDPFPKEEGPAVGIDERLGAKIPLDATFRDETGKTVRLGDLITGPTIILPVYYSCANVCNYLQGGLARVLPTIKNRPATEYRVISFSFDESETPQLAARYKRMYLTSMNVPFPEDGWRFLTGDAASIRRVTAAAGYRFQRRGRDFIHPVTTLVVARDGTIVRYLYGTTFLAKDVSLALLEAREGKAGASIRKVMEFCFSFDPTGKTYVFNLLRVSATVVILCAGGFLAFLLLGGTKRRKPGTLADKKGRD